MVLPSTRTPYQQLLRQFHGFERLSFFIPGSTKESVQATLNLLENIQKPDRFNQFIIQRSNEFEKITNALNNTEPITSSDPFEERKVIQMSADLTKLINDYNDRYEPSILTLIEHLFRRLLKLPPKS